MRSFAKLAVPMVVAATAVVAAGCVSQSPAGGTRNAGDVTITLTPTGCRPEPESAPAGVVNFDISNDGADRVTEAELLSGGRMLGEQENLSPGLTGGFSLHLDNGRYQVYCPGAARERFDFTVTGTATSSWRDDPALVRATEDYAAWISGQVGRLVATTQSFVDAVRGGDLSRAEVRYAAARVYYERVEPVAEIWSSLDRNIDGRLDDFDRPNAFQGFHKLEQMIFQQRTSSGASGYADQLLSNVEQLQVLVRGASYQPAEIADGATSLVDEIQSTKVTGEEERYSHVDLVDIRANLDGAQQAFAVLQPALTKTDPDLVSTVRDRYKAIVAALRPFQARPGYLDTGYVDYATVDSAARRALSQVVNAYGEEMSKVAAKVA